MENVIIIGSGAAGLAAGVYTARAGLKPLIVAGSLPGGLLTQTSEVENFPGFPDGVNGFDLMDKCREQAEKFGSEIVYEEVEKVSLVPGGNHKIVFASGEEKECKALIIATGSSPRYLGLEGRKNSATAGYPPVPPATGHFIREFRFALWAAEIRLWRKHCSLPILRRKFTLFTEETVSVRQKSWRTE